ncbi:MAG: hypothetical protein QME94_12400 [Anaerolineae bacterium]|nr:hypothetical protein [Anaerolineae bacterium]
MQWVSEHTPESSAFLVVTGDTLWGGDRSSEWFPVLAGRRSVATVQGTEWLAGFSARTRRYTALQRCARQSDECLESWAAESGVSFTHVYIPKRPSVARSARDVPCCAGLPASLRSNERYRVVYDGPGATVFEREAHGTASLADAVGGSACARAALWSESDA